MRKLFKCLLWILPGFLTIQEMSNGEEEIMSPWRNADQSTQYSTMTADLGVDGDPTTCSHTQSQTDPWWKLGLKHDFLVNTVAITNLNSAYYHTRINGAVLHIGNYPYDVYSNPICAQIPTIESGATVNFSCGGMEGRYVVIHIPGDQKILNICEAVIYGYMPENVALCRPVYQSSRFDYCYGKYAMDGLTETCSQTTEQTNPWWKVNLVNRYRVNRVAITNRLGSNHFRINGAVIRIGNFLDDIYSNHICAEITTIASGATANFMCGGMEGQYVIIHIPGDLKILSLCEVDIFVDLIGNQAIGGAATQSSTSGDWSAERAIDGDRGLQRINKGCSSTLNEANPWLRVDLRYFYFVNRITIANRNDSKAQKITGMEIRVGDSLENNGNNNPICAVVAAIPIGATYNYTCNEMEGRYINLIIPGDMKTLSLCEVEVFGQDPRLRRSIVKVQLNSRADLTDQKTRENIQQKLGSAFADRGFPNITLTWSEKVVQKVETTESCSRDP